MIKRINDEMSIFFRQTHRRLHTNNIATHSTCTTDHQCLLPSKAERVHTFANQQSNITQSFHEFSSLSSCWFFRLLVLNEFDTQHQTHTSDISNDVMFNLQSRKAVSDDRSNSTGIFLQSFILYDSQNSSSTCNDWRSCSKCIEVELSCQTQLSRYA